MRLDELMGSLQAYEMNLNSGRREEDISLKAEATSPKEKIQKEDKADDAINNHTSLPTVLKNVKSFRNFSVFASPVTTSIATSGESVCEEITETDLLHGYELMINKLDKIFVQNKKLAKELKECQEKLNNAEKPINNLNKGKAKIEEVCFQTGGKGFLMNYKECSIGHVTFGDGQKGQVVGKGTLMVPGYQRLKNILHVEGLRANLLSISQLCDQNLVVKFTHDRCMVYDEAEAWTSELPEPYEDYRNESCLGSAQAHEKGRWCMRTLSTGKAKSCFSHSGARHWYTWVDFLKEKSDTFGAFKKLCMQLQNEKECQIGKIVRIRSDHGREFENAQFVEFSREHGIRHEFSAPKTPQENGVVERKNRTLQKMARVIFNSKKLSTRDQLGKFDKKSDEGLFMGYSTTSRAYRTQGASSEPNKPITKNHESADEELQAEQEVATQVTTPTTTTETAPDSGQDSDRQQVITDVATEVTTGKIISESD
ncbi:uncharacterized protein LOC120268581 [Dioscorea cayenensis subsp. rotundata]|uniref:Uncharacterized protein LOC120268581 n=1 Tax=Dioscorea cayennensis subsp. rotundata TaxID=55577 RepID=A0AB40BZJ5_DIOCR|nr:uncharacterized protein LOC120268581 [Dioscorea cayenensis subsp. rotundata]